MQRNCRQLFPRAFTLIELLVVIAIIAMLLAILMPALSAAKEQGMEAKCKATLNQFGKGFTAYSVSNGEYYCSGSFDPELSKGRDGPVDQVGWVADLVNSKTGVPAEQLCPSNESKYNQKLGASGNTYNAAQAMDLISRGYNTNYTQSWYMGRTEWNPDSGDYNTKKVKATFGALYASRLKSVASSRVPLLGDGRSDINENVLGERCVKTMTDGPFNGPYGIQTYRDFGPAHGRGSWIMLDKRTNRIRANVLFADAHVDVFNDKDRDGEFALDDTVDPPTQKDLDESVFDGVLTIGRRSASPDQIQ